MHPHTIEPTPQQPQSTEPPAAEADVAPVGTFAAGQSARGSFEVAAAAAIGTFAHGLEAEDRPASMRVSAPATTRS